MTAPRIDIDLDAIEANTRSLVERLAPRGIGVTGVTKATLGSPGVGEAMLRGGAHGLGDSRLPNLGRLAGLDGSVSRTLIRSPQLSQVGQTVRAANVSLNTEQVVLQGLQDASNRYRRTHDVVLMVELGDLREGIAVDDVDTAVRFVLDRHALRLVGLGANLACQNGVVPDDRNMGVLSDLVDRMERRHGLAFDLVSGGNSASLDWALTSTALGRVTNLRLGEALLLGVEPLNRTPVEGLRRDAFTVYAEIIESGVKPARPWGQQAQAAFGTAPARTGSGTVRQALVALGRQDVDPAGITPPSGTAVLGMSSDHLVLDLGDHPGAVGDELAFGLDYSALVRAMTSPFVTKVEHLGLRPAPRLAIVPT